MEIQEKVEEQKKKSKESVQSRLKRSYLIIFIIMGACIVVGIGALVKVNSDYEYAVQNYGFAQGYAGQLGTEFNEMTTNLRSLILETDETEIASTKSSLDTNSTNINAYLENVRSTVSTTEEEEMLAEMEEAIEIFRDIRDRVVDFAAANQNDEAYTLMKTEAVTEAKIIKDNIAGILELNIDRCNETVDSARTLATSLIILIVIMAVIAIAVGVKLSVSISKSICDPLAEVTAAARKLQKGELDVEINFKSQDELGVLADAMSEACQFMQDVIRDTNNILKQMSEGDFRVTSACKNSYIGEFEGILLGMRNLRDAMNQALKNIQEASTQVALGSNQMAESAQGLAEGATEQAGAVQELMATVENVSSLVQENASNAEASYRQAADYAQEAQGSSKAMAELTGAMDRISETSKQIGNIIAEIEDIASQTNLLSLNATIEAARAGEAGKGFAVVADQISKLAAESAQSALNTRNLIESSISEIENGNQIAERTSQALTKVVAGMESLGEAAKENSHSAVTQAEAIKQIETGIEQISGVVQSNSAAAEETSATSEELSAQAANLNNEVDKFQLI